MAQRLGPAVPGRARELLLEGEKQPVAGCPGVVSAKFGQDVRCLRASAEHRPGGAQQPFPDGRHPRIVHRVLGKPRGLDPISGQQAVADQHLRADEQRVAGKGGETHVGRVAEHRAGGAERQDLPGALPGAVEKIDEIPRGLAEIADAQGTGQGEQGQENSA